MNRHYWAIVAVVELSILIVIMWLLRHSFDARVGFGNKTLPVSKPLSVLLVWLSVSVPVLLAAKWIRRFLQ